MRYRKRNLNLLLIMSSLILSVRIILRSICLLQPGKRKKVLTLDLISATRLYAPPFFFQFKRGSTYGNGTFDCGDPLKSHIGTKLRYSLHKQKYSVFHAQHNILKNLSDSGNSVFYASPSTIYRMELLEQTRHHTILDSSWIFDLSQFPLLQGDDNSTHRVYYPDAGTVGYFCSDSKEITPTKIKSSILETNIFTRNAKDGRELSEKYLFELLDKILKSVMPDYKPGILRKGASWDDLGTVQKITQVLSDRLPDLSWVLVYKNTESEK